MKHQRKINITAALISLQIFMGCSSVQHNKVSTAQTFADHWEFVGVAVEEPGYTIWGTSPIMGDDGKTHLFVARWPCSLKVDPGWRSHSEIAHYVGDNPEGPFAFSDIAIKGTGTDTWDSYGASNPTIQRVGNKYILLYIANNNPKQPPHPSNQNIGMAIAESPYGPWKKTGEGGLILSTPTNNNYWNHKASNGVNNPALLQHPDGGFFLYFKSEKAKMGLAVAEEIEGPYVQLPTPVTANDKAIEDGYAFEYKGKIHLLTTDNHGIIEEGGGILWTSDNGMQFNGYEQGFKRINEYTNVDMSKVAVHYGPTNREYAKFERPQILMQEGVPTYLYLSSGTNIYGGNCTVSYILKYVE
ncbi:MAG: glycoside hydrolase family protein [Bacteroidota bacterium]